MEDKKIIEAINQAMDNLYETKIDYSRGSYEDPYLFICSEDIAEIIKRTFKVDENNIFLNGYYYQLCIQIGLQKEIEVELENEKINKKI